MKSLSPYLPPDNKANEKLAYAKFVSNCLLRYCARGIKCANLANLRPLQSTSTAIVLGSGLSIPALCHLVVGVIFMRSKEQMRRVAARWIVTVVADAKAGWYFSIGETVGNTMRVANLSPKSKESVAFCMAARRPLPASFGMAGFINLGPKVIQLSRREYSIYGKARRAIRIFSGGHNAVMPIVRAFESLIRLLRPTNIIPGTRSA